MTAPSITAALLCLGAGFLGSSIAGTTSPATAATPAATGILTGHLAEGSLYDQVWSTPLLYKNPANPVLQELAVQGIIQAQYAYGSSNHGTYSSGTMPAKDTWDDADVRRFYFGIKARMFQSWKFHSLLYLNPDFSPQLYRRIMEAYLTYAPCDAFNLTVGKAELKFTREQEVSSREILPFERSQLLNMFYGGELTGVWISGKGIAGGWLYELGVYGNDRQDEWTTLDGGAMILPKIGYNYTKLTTFDLAKAELHYLHNTKPGYKGAIGTSPSYSDCIAISNDLTKGRFSLATEFFWGDGANGVANAYGITAMPAWFITDKLQLVTTVQLAGSPGANGICLPLRYEGQVDVPASDKTGDTYFAGYAGLNYYLYGHKLKVMSGVKYTNLSGGDTTFAGWTWLLGCRASF